MEKNHSLSAAVCLILERLSTDEVIQKSKFNELTSHMGDLTKTLGFLTESGFVVDEGDSIKASAKLKQGLSEDDIMSLQDYVLGSEGRDFRRLMVLFSKLIQEEGKSQAPVFDFGKKDEPDPEAIKKYVRHYIDVSDIKGRQNPPKAEGGE
ncbi:MAG: hypothetical protein KKD39_08830 [Candidatus Altiarchaeota archaeon]|nr:hypothetical protein [Candidatus Altiarchaeota archaeon]